MRGVRLRCHTQAELKLWFQKSHLKVDTSCKLLFSTVTFWFQWWWWWWLRWADGWGLGYACKAAQYGASLTSTKAEQGADGDATVELTTAELAKQSKHQQILLQHSLQEQSRTRKNPAEYVWLKIRTELPAADMPHFCLCWGHSQDIFLDLNWACIVLTILFFLDGVESQAPTPGRLVCQKVCTFTASFQLLQACIVWVCLNVVVFWWFWLKSAASASLGSLKTPPTKTSNTTPHYKPKYEILVIAKNCGTISDKLFRQLKLDQTLIRF